MKRRTARARALGLRVEREGDGWALVVLVDGHPTRRAFTDAAALDAELDVREERRRSALRICAAVDRRRDKEER
jgi:hypothetical protein